MSTTSTYTCVGCPSRASGTGGSFTDACAKWQLIPVRNWFVDAMSNQATTPCPGRPLVPQEESGGMLAMSAPALKEYIDYAGGADHWVVEGNDPTGAAVARHTDGRLLRVARENRIPLGPVICTVEEGGQVIAFAVAMSVRAVVCAVFEHGAA